MNLRFLPEKIELWEIHRLVPNAKNARTHSPEQITEIARSMRAFGFMSAVFADTAGNIIAGHARVLAAREIGLKLVPVVTVDHLSEQEKQSYAIADNQIALHAGWDDALLRVQLEELRGQGMDLAVIGFSEKEFNTLIDDLESSLRRAGEDSVPDPVENAVTQPSDVWKLGDHRLLCGDGTDQKTVGEFLAGESAAMVFTDPPYNVAYKAPEAPDGSLRHAQIPNDDLGQAFSAFLERACRMMLEHTAGALYICISSSELHTLHQSFVAAGRHWSTFIIWGKSIFTLGRSDYHRQFEPILYGWKEGQQHYWCGARDQGDLWLFDKPHANDLHPTMKPVALIERAIRNSSQRNELVFDPFGGSGSTLIASEQTGRRARLIEIEPRYCDVIIQRWQEISGQSAVHERSRQKFDEIVAERAIPPNPPSVAPPDLVSGSLF
jgi:DNA modification methylase